MKTNSISFGNVTAVTGKPKTIAKLNKKLNHEKSRGNLIIRDVTTMYKNVSSAGEMAQAAQRGELVDIYITGDDIKRIKDKEQGWRSLSDILCNITNYFNANTMRTNEVIENLNI